MKSKKTVAVGLVYLVLTFWANLANGEIIGGWSFFGNTPMKSNFSQEAQVSHEKIRVSAAVKGSGVQVMSAGLANTWTIRGLAAATLEDAIAEEDFVYFTITPDAGYQVTITNLSFYATRNDSSAARVALLTSAGGFAADDAAGGVSVTTAIHMKSPRYEMSDLNITVTKATQVRLYLYGLTADAKPLWFGDSDSDLGDNGLLIQGTVIKKP